MAGNASVTIAVTMQDCAADHGAIGLIAPLGIDTDAQRFMGFEAPAGWRCAILAEARTGQLAAMLWGGPASERPTLRHSFSSGGPGLPDQVFAPEPSWLTKAAPELAAEAVEIARQAGGGQAGLDALVADTSARFSYAKIPYDQRYYYGRQDIPAVACAAGNCIDINTYLIAGLRAAGYEVTYLTCYFFPDQRGRIPDGMHCWVRTRHNGTTQDWDIAHFKKLGREDVRPTLNPMPGQRWALAYGRDHIYRWQGREIVLSTPSVPVWVREDGAAIWPAEPEVRLADGAMITPSIARAEA